MGLDVFGFLNDLGNNTIIQNPESSTGGHVAKIYVLQGLIQQKNCGFINSIDVVLHVADQIYII